jgi:hypothetical protein
MLFLAPARTGKTGIIDLLRGMQFHVERQPVLSLAEADRTARRGQGRFHG